MSRARVRPGARLGGRGDSRKALGRHRVWGHWGALRRQGDSRAALGKSGQGIEKGGRRMGRDWGVCCESLRGREIPGEAWGRRGEGVGKAGRFWGGIGKALGRHWEGIGAAGRFWDTGRASECIGGAWRPLGGHCGGIAEAMGRHSGLPNREALGRQGDFWGGIGEAGRFQGSHCEGIGAFGHWGLDLSRLRILMRIRTALIRMRIRYSFKNPYTDKDSLYV